MSFFKRIILTTFLSNVIKKGKMLYKTINYMIEITFTLKLFKNSNKKNFTMLCSRNFDKGRKREIVKIDVGI